MGAARLERLNVRVTAKQRSAGKQRVSASIRLFKPPHMWHTGTYSGSLRRTLLKAGGPTEKSYQRTAPGYQRTAPGHARHSPLQHASGPVWFPHTTCCVTGFQDCTPGRLPHIQLLKDESSALAALHLPDNDLPGPHACMQCKGGSSSSRAEDHPTTACLEIPPARSQHSHTRAFLVQKNDTILWSVAVLP